MQTVAPPAAPAQAPGTPQAGRWMQSVHADVTVPFEASAITGAMITSIVLLVAGLVIYWQRWPLMDVLIPLTIGALGIWLSTTLAFWFRERQDIKTTWWRAEERDQVDYTGDGQIGRPEPTQIRGGSDPLSKPSEEQLTQLRFEEFITRIYNADKRTVPAIRRLGFTDAERVKFTAALREAQLIRSIRGGNSAAWEWVYNDAEKCLQLARKRVMWRIPSSSSSSSPAK
jgi:hypothetical protein